MIHEVTIEKLVTGGEGLARLESGILFVRDGIPGERVVVRETKRGKGFARAEIVEILRRSPDRVTPPESSSGFLEGANLAHMTVPAQQAAKREIVRDCFLRIGRHDVTDLVEGPFPAGPEWKYRNKITLHGDGSGKYGLYRPGTRSLVPIERSLLLPDQLHMEALPLLHALPSAEEAVIRFDGAGRFLLALDSRPRKRRRLAAAVGSSVRSEVPPHSCAGILVSGNAVFGVDHLIVTVRSIPYQVHGESFFQVNTSEAEAMVAHVERCLDMAGITGDRKGSALLDVYGGVGLFGCALAARFDLVRIIESDRHAVRDATVNARQVDDQTIGVVSRTVESLPRPWEEFLTTPGATDNLVAIVDPPRAGIAPVALEWLLELGPPRIFYISCDPATLARDCKKLREADYQISGLRLFDMFPQTSHVEAIVELEL